jgi:high-affinity nickel permease
VFVQQPGRNSGFWFRLQAVDFNTRGYLLVGMFVPVWAVSLWVVVAELNRTELQTKFPTIATEIPH